jgi:hypothetical protein
MINTVIVAIVSFQKFILWKVPLYLLPQELSPMSCLAMLFIAVVDLDCIAVKIRFSSYFPSTAANKLY